MAKGVIRLGDITSHGGEVISASSTITLYGKKVALVGDLISCPKDGHGVNAIIEGATSWYHNGKPVAVDGCLCACGCTLLSSLPEVNVG
ncbi:PAAR domain-containing protein [Limnobaculum parvum]|uniref:PAAR domain-containing protein n=1 Tax=Limnobaculum parvum TaxID=2172103 RepID=A0A2Y9U0G8_9GAMM|nr:PAAR domain-containing protein [Limnobaculum parvum]AWH89435.1 PAAR domain-containing protein [Limnobaculum parvum]